jgi:hypothetical protein
VNRSADRVGECRSTKPGSTARLLGTPDYRYAASAAPGISNDTLADTSTTSGDRWAIALALPSHWNAWHHFVHWGHGGDSDAENLVNR